jgi:hypothetical protein
MSFMNLLRANRKFFPASTYFDTLYAEFKSLDPPIPGDAANEDTPRGALEAIKRRRDDRALPREDKFSWDDVYKFELILLNYLPVSNLRNKVVTLRGAYLNIFGQDKYRTYLEINPDDPMRETDPDKLRGEARFLLHQISLALAALSSREGLGKWLTLWAAYLVVLASVLTVLLFLGSRLGLTGSPLKVAFAAGAMGGLLSILHRLQSIPAAGDPIYSLATFWHGAYALFVSPLTGAIFGILIYLFFAGGVLQGRVFPNIATPSGKGAGECGDLVVAQPAATTQPTPAPTAQPGNVNNANARGAAQSRNSSNAGNTSGTTNTSATSGAAAGNTSGTTDTSGTGNTSDTGNTSTETSNSGNTSAANNSSNTGNTSNTAGGNRTAANSNTTAAATPTPSPSPSSSPGGVYFNQFLKCSTPATGIDYALLIIWCFLAGFAERLVPDTLNRLVDETDSARPKKQ